MHSFLNRFRPAFGLLRGGFNGTLSAKALRGVESGPSNVTNLQPQEGAADAADNAPQSRGTEILEANHEEHHHLPVASSNADHDHIKQEEHPQPQFTEGPSRFVLANDGSRECVALLVSETFLAKLNDLFQEDRDLGVLDAPLYHAKRDLRNIERSIEEGQNALETAESEKEAEECQKILEQKASELSKIRGWKEELEKERSLVEGNLELSRNHTKWVLETAMGQANLLGPVKPLPAVLVREEEPEDEGEDIDATGHLLTTTSSPVASVASDNSEAEVSQEDLQRQEAYKEFVERSEYLDIVQEKFDSQGDLYRENLAEYQEMAAAGTIDMSRSDFDRRKVQYGQQLTRALIDAEEEFEEAREHAQALGAIDFDHEHEFYYGAEYEESWPENKIAEYNASHDWGYIEHWIESTQDSSSQTDVESVEIDEWDAEEVDVNDSISMIDCEEYRQDIDRYRRICARLEDPCPEARWLGQPDAKVLERRLSF